MQQVKFQLIHDEHVDFGSGRIEIRRCYVETKLVLYDSLQAWPHLRSIVMVEAIRDVDGVQKQQTRFYLSDPDLSAQAFNTYVHIGALRISHIEV